MVTLSIKIHQSLWIEGEEQSFSGEFMNETIITALSKLLTTSPKVMEQVLRDGHKKPGILFIYDKTELSSLGLLEQPLTEDMSVRIVPILHGG